MKSKMVLAIALFAFSAVGMAMAQDAVAPAPDAPAGPIEPALVPLPADHNPALASNGSKVTTDSLFPGYTNVRLTDGVLNEKNLSWSKSGWASKDNTPNEHWAVIEFAKPTEINKITIYWCFDKFKYHSAVTYKVQYWNGTDWTSVKEETAGVQNIRFTEFPFVKVTTSKIRYLQASAGGEVARPKIAWIAEITATSTGPVAPVAAAADDAQ